MTRLSMTTTTTTIMVAAATGVLQASHFVMSGVPELGGEWVETTITMTTTTTTEAAATTTTTTTTTTIWSLLAAIT